MEKKYEMLRIKMARFNEWEAKNRKNLPLENRLEQFLALYDLSRTYDDDVRRKMHENHLKALIETNQRLNRQISLSRKRRIVQSLAWDYDVREDRLLEVLLGLREKEGPFDQEKIFLRALERLPWHDILEIMGKEKVTQLLTPERIVKLRLPGQRKRYERIRKILRGEPVSLSGWNPIHRETYQRALLSNRWYRSKQAL